MHPATVALPALVGGLTAAAVVLALAGGLDHDTSTVLEQAPMAAASVADGQRSLTAGEIYRRAAPGVVFIRAEIVQRVESPFGFGAEERGEATGTGFVIDSAGRIVTNYHVIAGASAVSVKFADARSVPARIIGTDSSKDVALLRVDAHHAPLRPLILGDSRGVQVGDPVLALGNPFGLDRTLTSGIVSALQRSLYAPDGFTIDDVIQTDAAINPGNSGGPLLDAAGRVIGINSQIATGQSGSSVGIGFAVPIDTVKADLPSLERTGHGRTRG